jgi:filamentous hemagglutinin
VTITGTGALGLGLMGGGSYSMFNPKDLHRPDHYMEAPGQPGEGVAEPGSDCDVSSTNPPKINMGRQGKHIPGHNNYQPGKSILRANPEELARHAGTGRSLRGIPVGQPCSRELVDFGRIIGDAVDEATGATTPTRWGVITYGKDGIHIFPVRPQ